MSSEECRYAMESLNEIREQIQAANVSELSEPLLELLQVVAGIIGDIRCRDKQQCF